jgi:ubiquinone/menaquinone biosynthesis C-methylase UbiE
MADGLPGATASVPLVLASARPIGPESAALASRIVREAGLHAQVTHADGPGDYAERVARAVAATRGDYVLVADPGALDPNLLASMWGERLGAGLVVGVPSASPDAGWRARLAVRVARRVLSLPVRPDATVVLGRREALAGVVEGATRFEWLLATVVHANADGWPVVRVGPAATFAPADAAAGAATLRRLWALRNSAFSADYDDRAYDSLIPLQRYWQRARYRIITGFVDPGSHILDIGCGSSRIVQALPHAVGLDIQLKKLRRISGSTRKLVQATLTRLPFRDGAFETLICSQVIEHVPEPLVDWREFNRVLAPGGTFVVGTPDYATVAWPLLEWLYGIVHPKGYVNEHINRYTAASLRRCLEQHGFTVTGAAYVGGGELIYRARKTSA